MTRPRKTAGPFGDRLIRSLLANRESPDPHESAVFVRLILFVAVETFGNLAYGIGFIGLQRYLAGAILLLGAAAAWIIFGIAYRSKGVLALQRVTHVAVFSLVVTITAIAAIGGEASEISAWYLALAAGGAVFLLSERAAFVWMIIIVGIILGMPLIGLPLELGPAYEIEPWEEVLSRAGMAFIVTWFAAAVRRTTDAHIDTLTSHDRYRAAQNVKLRAALFEEERAREELIEAKEAAEAARGAAERAKGAADRARAASDEARKMAEDANLAKSRFLANMSHELRTPLSAILGYSELIMEEAEETGMTVAAEDIGHIHSAGRHLLKLINDLLDIAKIEAGRSDVQLEHFDVQALVLEVVETVRPMAEANGNTLMVDVRPGIRPMWSDPTRMKQIVINLVSNAAKFTTDGEITIEMAGHGPSLLLTVADTGIGIDPGQLSVIFEPFRQAEMSFDRSFDGTGLGLTIARSCAELLGGGLEVKSEPGLGTTFRATVPFEAQPATLAITGIATRLVGAQVTATGSPRSVTTVLVIDDDPAVREIIARQLNRTACYVLTAPTGEAGLALAREQLPNVVLLDVQLPRMDGWAVLSALKSSPKTANVPVVMLTNVDDADLAYSLGASDFLRKPVERDELVASLNSVGVNVELLDARP
ncbi:MAG: signal transduction histidine kinase/ActR/RegA family two-component response regulator [Bradymonadia bacterium]|jgi:signal transduction histidine kinase/ActR/RegA family two-component response regulator